jgi:hypothetical protein
MVNGKTSRIVVIGALLLLALLVVSTVVLTALHDAVPIEITGLMTGTAGLVLGTFFKPITNTDANGNPLAPTQLADGKGAP